MGGDVRKLTCTRWCHKLNLWRITTSVGASGALRLGGPGCGGVLQHLLGYVRLRGQVCLRAWPSRVHRSPLQVHGAGLVPLGFNDALIVPNSRPYPCAPKATCGTGAHDPAEGNWCAPCAPHVPLPCRPTY